MKAVLSLFFLLLLPLFLSLTRTHTNRWTSPDLEFIFSVCILCPYFHSTFDLPSSTFGWFQSPPSVLQAILVCSEAPSNPGALGLKHMQHFSVWHAFSWWSRCCYFSKVASFVLCDKVRCSPPRALSNVLSREWHIKQACYPFSFCFDKSKCLFPRLPFNFTQASTEIKHSLK